MLSPLRKDTKVGADALNPVLRDIVNPKRYGYPEIKNGSTTYRERDLVMQLKNEEDVADAMAETVLTCWEKISTLRKNRYVKTWMIRILLNKCYDLLRKKTFADRRCCDGNKYTGNGIWAGRVGTGVADA